MSALAWSIAVTHAERHENLYREEFFKHKYFYASLLDDYHRRFQSFVQSCAFGQVDKLKITQLHFEKLTEAIELFEYNVRIPTWLQKRRNDKPPASPNPNEPPPKRTRPNPRSTNGRHFVRTLVGRYNANNNNPTPKLPSGNPPPTPKPNTNTTDAGKSDTTGEGK